MIYIFGVNHQFQWDDKLELSGEFKRSILDIIDTKRIELIGEEFSIEACRRNNITNSVLYEIAVKKSIKHVYCDPNTKERKKLGIPTSQEIRGVLSYKVNDIQSYKEFERMSEKEEKKYWCIREKEWLNRIRRGIHNKSNILIIIGNDHVDSFADLLKKENIQFEKILDDQFVLSDKDSDH